MLLVVRKRYHLAVTWLAHVQANIDKVDWRKMQLCRDDHRAQTTPKRGVVANTLKLYRNGAVGFIVWLGERRLFLGVLSFLFGWRCVSLRFNLLRDLLAAFLRKLLL